MCYLVSSKIDMERSKRKNFAVYWARFLKVYTRFSQHPICFVEGEDIKYYGVRVENILRSNDVNFIVSGGKKSVINFKSKIANMKELEGIIALYFVDRDFDLPLNDLEIYETPCYSVENFYTSREVLIRILISEFGLMRTDDEFEKCLGIFDERQKEFHELSLLLNAWIACQRSIERTKIGSGTNKLNLGNLKLTDFFNIRLDGITAKYDIDELAKVFPHSYEIEHLDLELKKRELRDALPQKSYRGKFEIEFFRLFIDQLAKLARQGGNEIFPEIVNVKTSITKVNIISDLSRFADTPLCLEEYVMSRCLSTVS